ncbi:transporter [Ganoderma sinense ZZ0214-1]|uniref:Transporter n=1 Tax=Ganoderma sinense ZZ0214-1 TaxID=1077348 RepID=A0A2G8SHM9_9APHY|nr:transporter [Ganoderma sinense ZZ0214-1]
MPTTAPTAKMQYVRLGNSGLKVSKIILGTMQYGSPEWQAWVLGEDEALKQIKFAYEHGIQTFDTANVYSNGHSETVLGNAVKKLGLPRDELVIMTKVYFPVPADPSTNLFTSGKKPEDVGIINQHGLNRKHIFDSVKASLKRLQMDYIDVLQCHRFDYDTPIEETMQALHDVVQAGYVRYIGMSSCYAYQFHQMQTYALTHNLTPFISMQNHYNLVYREEEREMFPTLAHFGVGSIPWSPLARGLLTRPLDGAESKRGGSDWFIGRYKGEATANIVSRVEELAKKKGVSMAQVAVAWVLAKPHVTAPIVGTTSLSNLEDILGGLNVKLSEEEIKSLEEPYKPMAVTGHY